MGAGHLTRPGGGHNCEGIVELVGQGHRLPAEPVESLRLHVEAGRRQLAEQPGPQYRRLGAHRHQCLLAEIPQGDDGRPAAAFHHQGSGGGQVGPPEVAHHPGCPQAPLQGDGDLVAVEPNTSRPEEPTVTLLGGGLRRRHLDRPVEEAGRLLPGQAPLGHVCCPLHPRRRLATIAQHGSLVPMAGQIGGLGVAGAVVGLDGLGDPAVGLGEGAGPEGGLDAVAHEDVHEAEGPRRPTGLHQPGGLGLGQRLETHESRLAHRCRHQSGGKCPADDGCGPQDIATVPRATVDPAVDRLAQGRRHRSDVATCG